MTGHLLISTLHTNDALRAAVTRLNDLGIDHSNWPAPWSVASPSDCCASSARIAGWQVSPTRNWSHDRASAKRT
ncbi:MAG: ATPase, T2SS/T4P/T4SS family [Pirellulaceae bacterium]